jgi:hypothetical protein
MCVEKIRGQIVLLHILVKNPCLSFKVGGHLHICPETSVDIVVEEKKERGWGVMRF